MTMVMASLVVSGTPASAEMCPPTTLAEALPEIYGEPSTTTTTETDGTAEGTTPTDESTETTVAGATTTTTVAPPEAGTDPTTPSEEEPPVDTTTTTVAPPECTPFYKAIHAPLPGRLVIGSRFAADRDGGTRHHEGIDLPAPRMTPVLAVADGTVTRIGEGNCCTVRIRHADGWSSSYVHLNNDRWGTDDGLGIGIVPGLEVGDTVRAGDVIGYVGDSTNAETTQPHLHFALRMPNGTAVDALESIRRSTGIDDFAGAFADDEGALAELFLDRAASVGAVVSCSEDGRDVCPDALLEAEAAERLVASITGHVVAAPVALAPTGFGMAPELPPLSGANLRTMLEEALRIEAVLDLPFDGLLEPDPDDTGAEEPLLAVGCLWQPPADDTYPTLAEAVVTTLVAWGDAVAPECAFTPTAP